ncbi:MAG: YybH family protein [Longimicrobiaceae bacterium]
MLRFAPLLLTLSIAACATARPAAAPAGAADPRQIEAILRESTVAWNRGDLEGFLRPYLHGPNVTFMGNDVVRGFDAIREFYRGSWFRTGAPTVNLAYRGIEVRPLGRDYALVLGKWAVMDKNTGQETRHGDFSLTWMRTPEGWRIIHDHSS